MMACQERFVGPYLEASRVGPVRSVALQMFLVAQLGTTQDLKDSIFRALQKAGVVQESNASDSIEGLKIAIRPGQHTNLDLFASSGSVMSELASTVILSIPTVGAVHRRT